LDNFVFEKLTNSGRMILFGQKKYFNAKDSIAQLRETVASLEKREEYQQRKEYLQTLQRKRGKLPTSLSPKTKKK
jgi:hypothetical protein